MTQLLDRPVTAAGDIDLVGISRRFGETTALDAIDLHIPAGSLTAIVGPSGCGKSTLLRILAGLDTPSSGVVQVAGESVASRPLGQRDVAMVFQDYALYPHMTVERNISFGLRLARRHDRTTGPSHDEIAVRVDQVARLLGLTEVLGRRPGQLSGGQRQRVALARAIIRRPGVLLLDEPLSALDVALRASARAEILRLHREIGATLVLVTHDQHEALSMASHLVVMDRGRVVQSGSPQEVFRRPASVFVAGFVGSPAMNLTRSADGWTGWRPTDARIVPDGTGDVVGPGDRVVIGVVDVCEFTGSSQELRCRTEAALEHPAGLSFTLVQREGERWLAPGDPVVAVVPAASVHSFDADGRRLDD
ncbi:ABC transporter ATP-binding protein [Agromyces badenianii]|uniref:ABC transporter ATP-binding protein n=1 Tax=Agromyces badenianii TaxID=2080742 RepID=UPI000D5A07E7|nr:ABC transporter ATP-binding protein [Agromyces badenianii]PWC03537.1 ABC transporter ATP-binding protein [Agromyces badenianii]